MFLEHDISNSLQDLHECHRGGINRGGFTFNDNESDIYNVSDGDTGNGCDRDNDSDIKTDNENDS